MWITMETYSIQNEEDIDKILLNSTNEFNNVFELNKENILDSNRKTVLGMDSILLKANLTPLKIQKTNSSKSLSRKNSKRYLVSCVNIKNNEGEYFSSLIDNLCENDRIIIINGVVLKQFTICNSNKLTVLVRPQDSSSVILFKYKNLLEESNSILEKNLSLITGSGVYSIFGNIKKILRFDDDELLSLTLLSCDKSRLKTLKYSHFVSGYKNINKETASGVKYDFCSNRVDILVKTPSNDFNSLSLDQRICLNNVKVKNINDSDIFLLHMNGFSHNIKADPTEIGIVNSLRPPTRHFLIPSELKPATKLKFKKISDDVKLVVPDNIQELKTDISPLKTVCLNVQQRKHNNMKCIDLSDDDDDDDDDDIVNLSPCQDFLTSTQIKKKDNHVHDSAGSLGKKKIDIIDKNSLPIKHFRSDNEIQKNNDNTSLTSSNKNTSFQIDTSPSSSTDGSCSPSFFNSQPKTSTLNQETESNNFKLNNVNKPTQCIGPCRLIHTVPNIFDNSEIVSGYCTKCNAFIQKCYLKSITQSSNVEYKCPKCFNIVHLTFFFIMNFLYGKNDSQAIEVCCYDKNAERIIRKISKIKMMNIEEYLSNQNNRQLVINSMKSLINNRTKVNIIVCLSPEDNKNILLGLDTKYVVTTTTH